MLCILFIVLHFTNNISNHAFFLQHNRNGWRHEKRFMFHSIAREKGKCVPSCHRNQRNINALISLNYSIQRSILNTHEIISKSLYYYDLQNILEFQSPSRKLSQYIAQVSVYVYQMMQNDENPTRSPGFKQTRILFSLPINMY